MCVYMYSVRGGILTAMPKINTCAAISLGIIGPKHEGVGYRPIITVDCHSQNILKTFFGVWAISETILTTHS